MRSSHSLMPLLSHSWQPKWVVCGVASGLHPAVGFHRVTWWVSFWGLVPNPFGFRFLRDGLNPQPQCLCLTAWAVLTTPCADIVPRGATAARTQAPGICILRTPLCSQPVPACAQVLTGCLHSHGGRSTTGTRLASPCLQLCKARVLLRTVGPHAASSSAREEPGPGEAGAVSARLGHLLVLGSCRTHTHVCVHICTHTYTHILSVLRPVYKHSAHGTGVHVYTHVHRL